MGRVRWIGAVGALALFCGCAGGGASAVRPTSGPPWKAFGGARTVALVHEPGTGKPGGPARDPVDGLGESLRARGWEVRVPPPEAAGALLSLRNRLEPLAGAPAGDAGPVTASVVEGAGEVVRSAGVDAVALAWRFVLRSMPRDPTLPRQMPALSPVEGPGRIEPPIADPLGALALVNARGDVLRVEWGDREGREGERPDSPAEASEALLEAIAPPADDAVTPAGPAGPAP